jgi:FSR family fosmidomycin resistance protein-like MFS transporter
MQSREEQAEQSAGIECSLGRAQACLGILTLAHFLNDGYINYLPAVLPVLLGKLDIRLALVGSLILALQGLGSILQPFMGWGADQVGGRIFILVGLGLSMLGASLIGLAPNYGLLLGLLMMAGLGNSIFHPQALASARALAQDRAGLMMSLFLVGGELGRGMWPSLAGLLVAWLGLQGLWLFVIPGALTLALLAWLAPSLPPQPHRAAPATWGEQRGAVLALVGFVGLRGTAMFGVVTFVPLLWHEHGGSLIGGASLISVMLVVGILGNLSGGALADRIGRRPILISSSLLSALFLAFFLFAHGLWLWIALALLGVAVFSTAPVTMLVGQDLFPASQSMGSGITLGVGNALGALAVFALGFAAPQYGLDVVLWFIAGLSLLGLPLAWFLPERAGQPAS